MGDSILETRGEEGAAADQLGLAKQDSSISENGPSLQQNKTNKQKTMLTDAVRLIQC